MADILIRDLPDDVVERLKRRAASKSHSLEQELRDIIIAAAPLTVAERVAIVDHFLALSKGQSRQDATDFIREDRDSRPPKV